jgi:hypothetical protein
MSGTSKRQSGLERIGNCFFALASADGIAYDDDGGPIGGSPQMSARVWPPA